MKKVCRGLLGVSLLVLTITACAAQRQYNPDWPALQGNVQRQAAVQDAPVPPLKVKWTFETEGRIVAPPVIEAGQVMVASRDGKIYALKLEDGAKLWEQELEQGGLFSSPLISEGQVLGGKWQPYYTVYAWDLLSGEPRWQKETGELVNRPPWVLADARFVYTHMDPPLERADELKVQIAAWERSEREVVWQTPLPGIPTVANALSPELLLVATDNERLYALERESGKIRWEATLSGEPASAPLVQQGRVYLATRTGFVYAFELQDGKVAWRYQYPETQFSGDLSLIDGMLLLPAGQYLHSFKLGNLEPGWKFRAPKEITAPVASHEFVYFGCANRMFYVLNRERGFVAGIYRTGEEILAAPALAGGLVLVGSTDGKLYAYEEGPRPKQQEAPSRLNQRW